MKGPDLKNYRKISKFSVGVSCALACLMFQNQVAVHAEEIAPEVGQENHLNQDEKVNDVENNISSDTETGTESLAEAEPNSESSEETVVEETEDQSVEEEENVSESTEEDIQTETNTEENSTEIDNESTQLDHYVWEDKAEDMEEIKGIQSGSNEKITLDFISEDERETTFNENWKLIPEDVESAKEKDFDDEIYETIDLPNDISIGKDFSTRYEAESGFLPGGVAWYRKEFLVPEKYADKRIYLNFDGSYMTTDLYINEKKVGEYKNGYTPFTFDITDFLVKDGKTENLLSVRVENKLPSSRWYSGTGIFRDVNISVLNPVHIDQNGITVITPNLEKEASGTVTVPIEVSVVNSEDEDKNIQINHRLIDADGNVVASTEGELLSVKPGSTVATNELHVDNPHLWDVENPYLYVLETDILSDGNVIDHKAIDYGFRYFNFDRDKGFFLNGKPLKIKGVSMHHDQGALGAVQNEKAIERQILMLKDMGANAIRSTHNPASTALIDLANKHGMLIIDEAFDGWTNHKNGNTNDFSKYFNEKIGDQDYLLHADSEMTWAEFATKAMVERGKNAPSIIMWSIGNEITEGASGDMSHYPEVAANLIKWVQEVDATRPVTIGDNRVNDSILEPINDLITQAGGVVGKNYKDAKTLEQVREKHPDWILYGSETTSAIHTRGEYGTFGRDNNKLAMSEYDNDSSRVGWGHSASKAWKDIIENDWNAGIFVWTGFDYIGEPTPWNGIGPGSVSGQGAKPNSSYFGIIDTAGFPKDTYYLYHSMWNDKENTLHLMSTWNDDEIVKTKDGKVQVDVYTDADRVELYLNDKLIGEAESTLHTTPMGHQYRRFDNDKPYPTFFVDWEEGTLSAKAFDKDGNEITEKAIGRHEISTSYAPTNLKLNTVHHEITADGKDLAYIEVDVLDEFGNIVSNADNMINFEIEGPGEIVGVDNGNQADTDSYKDTKRRAFHGKALVIVQSTKKAGDIKLTASSDDIATDEIMIKSIAPEKENEAYLESYEMPGSYYMTVGEDLELPDKVQVTDSNGEQEELVVNWNEEELSQITKPGNYNISGKLADSDYYVNVRVQVVNPVMTVENHSTFTYQGETPDLPEYLRAIDNQGKESILVPVTWNIGDETFDELGNVQIHGEANIFNETIPVISNVRVVEAIEKSKNIANPEIGKPVFSNGYLDKEGNITDLEDKPISDSFDGLNNDINNDGRNTNERWTTYSLRNDNSIDSFYLQLTWDQEYTFNNLNLWHYTDNNSILPGVDRIHFEYYDSEKEEWVNIPFSNITQVSYQSGVTPYSFVDPVTTDKLRIWLDKVDGRTFGFTEIEVLTYVEEELAHSKSNAQQIKINGEVVDISPDVPFEFSSAHTPLIETITEDNGNVTLIANGNQEWILRVKSEDGQHTTDYLLRNVYSPSEESGSEYVEDPYVEGDNIIEKDVTDLPANGDFHSEYVEDPYIEGKEIISKEVANEGVTSEENDDESIDNEMMNHNFIEFIDHDLSEIDDSYNSKPINLDNQGMENILMASEEREMVKKDNQTLPKTGVNVGVIVGGLTSLVSGLGLARKKKDKK